MNTPRPHVVEDVAIRAVVIDRGETSPLQLDAHEFGVVVDAGRPVALITRDELVDGRVTPADLPVVTVLDARAPLTDLFDRAVAAAVLAHPHGAVVRGLSRNGLGVLARDRMIDVMLDLGTSLRTGSREWGVSNAPSDAVLGGRVSLPVPMAACAHNSCGHLNPLASFDPRTQSLCENPDLPAHAFRPEGA